MEAVNKFIKVNRISIPLMAVMVMFTAICSIYQFRVVPYVVVISVITVTVLVVLGSIKESQLPVYIYGLALCLIWQTSMLGIHIVGIDIHTEYFTVNTIIDDGWNIHWANTANTSIVLTIVSPMLARIGLDPVWQFKALYPAICALSPLILYYAFKNIMTHTQAYVGALFFMIMPMFMTEVVSMVKSQVAYVFVAGFVYFLMCKRQYWQRALGIALCVLGCVLCHYAVGIVMMAFLCAITICMLVTNWGRLKLFIGKTRLPLKYILPVGISILVIGVMWYSYIGDGVILRTAGATGDNIIRVCRTIWSMDISNVITSDESHIPEYLEYTNPEAGNTYLDIQSPLVRTALGLDFMHTPIGGKLFRVIQILTEILLVAGFIYMLLKKRRDYPAEYVIAVVVAFVLLGACLFIPFFTTVLSVTRFYAIALFFIAPLIVLYPILTKWAYKIGLVAIVLVYFMFTSGLVFEVSKDKTMNSLNTPYSAAFSNYRIKLVGIYNADDLEVAEWAGENADVDMAIYTDYFGSSLLIEISNIARHTYVEPIDPHYILLLTDNVESQQWVTGDHGGLREYQPLPRLDNAVLEYGSGKAAVYYKGD